MRALHIKTTCENVRMRSNNKLPQYKFSTNKHLDSEEGVHLGVRGSGNRGGVGRCDGGGNLALLLFPHKHIAHDEDEDRVAQVDAHQDEGQHVSGVVSSCTARISQLLRRDPHPRLMVAYFKADGFSQPERPLIVVVGAMSYNAVFRSMITRRIQRSCSPV